MMKTYKIKKHPKFEKEFKKLAKKCPTLKDDFNKFINVLLDDLDRNNHMLTHKRYKQLQGYKAKTPVFKLKQFRCESIKKGNRSPFRFIFILDREYSIIFFVECYFKGKHESENKERIRHVFLNYDNLVIYS